MQKLALGQLRAVREASVVPGLTLKETDTRPLFKSTPAAAQPPCRQRLETLSRATSERRWQL